MPVPSSAGDVQGRAGRAVAANAAHALSLAWHAGPLTLITYVAATIALGVFPAATALSTKWLLDALQFPGAAVSGPASASPLLLVAAIGLMGLGTAVGSYVSTYLSARIQRGVTLLVQQRLYTAVNRLDGIRRFEEPAFLDRLRLAQQAANTAPEEVIRALFGGFQGVLGVVGFLGILLVISPVVTAVTVAAAVPALLVQLSVIRRQNDMMWRLSPRFRRQMFYQALILDLAAIKETRLFGTGGFLQGRMREETEQINGSEERLDRRILLSQAPLALLAALVASGGLVWMITAATRGEFTIGDVSAFIAAVAGVQAALGNIVVDTTSGYQALLLLGHYSHVVSVGPDLPRAEAPAPVTRLREGIRVEDVWFRYTDDGPWVLRGVTLTIAAGGTLALVGLNGAGKSTLVKLLCRMYDPTRGRILWDGTDIRSFDVGELRSRISAVFQDYMAYDLSARENIAIGALEEARRPEPIRLAAELAGVDGHIAALPRGYDTMLSRVFLQEDGSEDEGVTLSGGQWQRIAIARALVRRQRDLLFLDEPSSGLDAAAEQAVHDRLREFQRDATTVLISHRMGAVRHADRIVVLQDGVIVEEGSHTELMAFGGEYHRLFSIQAANYANVLTNRSKG